jgi:mRNA-degrading endonuclease RelE of RelBE toxin-antitoxin system
MRTLRWARRAAEFYDGLTEKESERVDKILAQISLDPLNAPGVKTLKGSLAGLRSRRIGSWRIIFEFDDHAGSPVDILVFDDRKDAYG